MLTLRKRFFVTVGILLTSAMVFGCSTPGPQAAIQATKSPATPAAAPSPTPVAVTLASIHNPVSSSYNRDCLSCHTDIMKRTTLSKDVKDAHVEMVPFVPGYDAVKGATNDNCYFCHKGSDLRDHSTGNVGRDVDVALCTACHGPNGSGKKLYGGGK